MPARTKSSLRLLLVLACIAYACMDQGPGGGSLKPAALQIVSGGDQSGTENSELGNPLVVKVVDSAGHPVSGQLINFRVLAGGGSMFAGSSITNADGRSQDRWTLGFSTADSQVAEARAVDNNSGAAIVFARFRATAVAPLTPAIAISAAAWHTCAVRNNGAAYCWGMNYYGPGGDGTTIDRSVPTAVHGGLLFSSISTGGDHSCGVATNGDGYCWGENDDGEAGDGGSAHRTLPSKISSGAFMQVSAGGGSYTCGLSLDGSALCWGSIFGGSSWGRTPTSVTAVKFAVISSGGETACGLTAAGAAYCWGINQYGEIGDGSAPNTTYRAPTAVSGAIQFSRIAAASGFNCGLDMTGAAYCWGNGYGTTPHMVDGALHFTEISAGWYHACAVTATGATWCWGNNQYGQLGDNSSTDRLSPVQVQGGHVFRQIAGGARHTCAIDDAGKTFCWGSNQFGQLGDGTEIDHLVPTATRPLTGS